MQKSSFKVVAIVSLFFFLATPISVFAQCGPNGCPGSGGSKNAGAFGAGGDQLSGVAQGFLLSQVLGGGRGGLGGLGGAGGGGGGPAGQVGQVLTLVGALTGNMGLLIAGMITSMVGGLGGSTPQQGAVDERYVGQGQGYGNGGGGNPYYPTPTPVVNPVASTCTSSVFIVKDTTATPNVTKPYPATATVAQNNCVLAINSDTAAHTVKVKKQGETATVEQAVAASASHIFRFAAKSTYSLCVDSVSTACTTVTVQ